VRIIRTAALAAIGLLTGCGDDGTSAEACTPSATVVCMETNSFDPTALTTARGTNVEWRNASDLAHTTTSSPGNPAACPTWDLTVNAGAGSVARVLMNAGEPVTCQYYCKLHATPTVGQMRGSVVLQ